ncbi:MAG: cell division protein FtsQ [Sphingobacteriaceae bacterium]|jgi:cell division protein FtsQ|nr:cell division protein FtsQ [Sphingobacteriaceae bacterium]
MLKRINWKAILIGFVWVVCLNGLVVLMSFIEGEKNVVKCRDVKILIPGTQSFIAREELDQIIMRSQGQLVGRQLNTINIHQLERVLRANPFIESAKVYADMDGIVSVQIKQREPVLRILNLTNQDFYIDRNGYKIPTSMNFTAKVLVANGFILEGFANRVDTLDTKLARDLYNTALFIDKDSLWSDQIEQLYVNQQSEIEMVPRVGNQRIILGTADSLQVKFRNLLAFYKKAMPRVGWDAYKTISLKYANQIVCEKYTKTDSTAMATEAKTDSISAVKVDSTKTIKNLQDTTKTSTD